MVVISIDTLRADHLGCYGSPTGDTPAIDALAREGVLFSQTAAPAPSTLSSHTSLMTGTYGRTHGAARNGYLVAPENVMLAELLQDRGYETAGFIGAYPLHSRSGFAQGFDHYDEPDRQRSGDRVNDRIARWLDRRRPGPFFLFVHYWDVHHPYSPPPPFDRRYRTDDLEAGGTTAEIKALRRDLAAGRPDGGRSQVLRALYAGEVAHVDRLVGELLADLRARGLYEQALLVLLSDHGEAMDEHWEYWNHGASTYETTTRIPLIVRLPHAAHGGTVVDRLVSLVDVAPTLLELLGVPRPGNLEGEAFTAALRGELQPPRAPVFIESTKPRDLEPGGDAWPNERKCRAIRTRRWKLIHRPIDGSLELYDLAQDPAETRNLYLDSTTEANHMTEELLRRLEAWATTDPSLRSCEDTSRKTTDALRDLGYADDE